MFLWRFSNTALNYIQASKAISEVGSYPNLQGVRWGVNSYDSTYGIPNIINALANGPVAVCFYIHEDFEIFFNNPLNRTGVYRWNKIPDTDPEYPKGHAVVIVSYDNSDTNNSYWLCKNCWGSRWADSGYFKIGFGCCGIDSWLNCTATVNQSCYAKIVPDLFPSLSAAFNYDFVNNEYACFNTPYTISADQTIPPNKGLIIYNGENLNLNSHSIVLTGGTINRETGSTLTGLKATLYDNSYTMKGFFGQNIQSAISAAPSIDGQSQYVVIEPGNYSENISASNKYGLQITGSYTNPTTINGYCSFYNCQSLFCSTFNSLGISLTNCVNANVIGTNINMPGAQG